MFERAENQTQEIGYFSFHGVTSLPPSSLPQPPVHAQLGLTDLDEILSLDSCPRWVKLHGAN